MSDLSSASNRLIWGSIPELLNNGLSVDIATIAADVAGAAGSVFDSTCSNKEHVDLISTSSAKALTAKWASFVKSVATRFEQLQTPAATDDAMEVKNSASSSLRRRLDEDDQETGEGGLVLEPLNCWSTFVDKQTDVSQWKTAACSCNTVAKSLIDDIVWSGQYGVFCDGGELTTDDDCSPYREDDDHDDGPCGLYNWNVNADPGSGLYNAINSVHQVCESMCNKM